MRGIAGHARFVIVLSTEELPGNRVHPAGAEGLVTFIERVFQIEQREHQAGRETRATATTDTTNLKTGTKEIILRDGSR